MYRQNPFGNPDGARADLKEITQTFLFNDFFAPTTTVYYDELLKKRFFIGAKGSGKTFCLRKVHALLKEKHTSVYVADEIETVLNCTETVIRFCNLFDKNVLEEKWKKLWLSSVYTSIISAFLFDKKLTDYCNEEQQEMLRKHLDFINLPISRSLGVYRIMQQFLYVLDTAFKVNQFLENIIWCEIEDDIQNITRYAPEIYILLDSVDEEYEHAPAFWLQCQRGLFSAGMQLLENTTLGEKLHLVSSMRANVFASIIGSEHSTKYASESHILYLNWNYKNIRYFLRNKISNLNDCYFIADISKIKKEGKNIETWLGINKIYNSARNIDEDLETYIIRHTRLTPRDIVMVCNHLAEFKKTHESDNDLNVEEFVRRVVHDDAKMFGNELITVCTKQLISSFLPTQIGRKGVAEGFYANDLFRETSRKKIKDILQEIQSDRLSYDEILQIDNKVDEAFGQRCYFLDILWQNVALGYYDEQRERVIYFTRHLEVDDVLPYNKRTYVLKTCLLDALGIVRVGAVPELVKEQ